MNTPKASTEQAEPLVTDAMIDAYLLANTAYWNMTDAVPTPPDKWRTGNPREATRISLMAALRIATPPAAPADEPSETTLRAMGQALWDSSQHDCEATLDEMRPVFEVARKALAVAQAEPPKPVPKP